MIRGRSKGTLVLLDAACSILETIQPATVRAVCYKLFVAGRISSMAKNETNKISRLLTDARERGEISWAWIVDETRSAERSASWDKPDDFARAVLDSYPRDYWSKQPVNIEVWSEKGTVRGTVAPVLSAYGVTFRVHHGYGSATALHEIADETRNHPVPLLAFYVGDWDPSGMHMSEVDLPGRLDKHGASVRLIRVALTSKDTKSGLAHFDAEEKRGDRRYGWFVHRYGRKCFELDALDPRILRDRVEQRILAAIDFDAWNRCKAVGEAEHRSRVEVMRRWGQGLAESAS